MSTLGIAVIAAAAALACYTLGLWMGLRSTVAVSRQADRYRLAWLSARRRARTLGALSNAQADRLERVAAVESADLTDWYAAMEADDA